MSPLRSRAVVGIVVALCLVLVLAGQAVAGANVPRGQGVATGTTMGRAGFAYLTGLRTLAAALLWNRLEPQGHEYYGGIPLEKQLYLVPNMRLVVLLDPQLEEPYYILPWILARNGHVGEALLLAREGVAANPRSGQDAVGLAQLTYIFQHDEKTASRIADRVLDPSTTWVSLDAESVGLRVVADIYAHAGQSAKSRAVLARLAVVDARIDRLHALGFDTSNSDEATNPAPAALTAP